MTHTLPRVARAEEACDRGISEINSGDGLALLSAARTSLARCRGKHPPTGRSGSSRESPERRRPGGLPVGGEDGAEVLGRSIPHDELLFAAGTVTPPSQELGGGFDAGATTRAGAHDRGGHGGLSGWTVIRPAGAGPPQVGE